MKPTVSSFEAVVVVGRATPLAANEAPHVIALPVPSSKILKRRLWKLVGVPLRFVVIEVIASPWAVIVTTSQLSVLIVGVA